MTIDQFLKEIHGYYGPYNPTQRKYVLQWLDQHPRIDLPSMLAEILKTLSASYKTPPGIAELEAALKQVREKRLPERQFLRIEGPKISEEERQENIKRFAEIMYRLNKRQEERDRINYTPKRNA